MNKQIEAILNDWLIKKPELTGDEAYNDGVRDALCEADKLVDRLQSELTAREAELAAVKADAKRYQYIRGSFHFYGPGIALPCGNWRQDPLEVDAAIDKAIEQAGGE